MANIVCEKCGTENGAEYSFCMGCGEPLVKPQARPEEPCSEKAGENSAATPDSTASVGNMPLAAAADFVGENANYYIPKFTKFDRLSSSCSWNWPVALFSFLLGMPFVWFFYRKMYKIGSVILAAYTILSIVCSVCAAELIDALAGFFGPFITELMSSDTGELALNFEQQFMSDFLTMSQSMSIPSMLIGLLSIANLAFCIYLPIAANKLYMNHMLKTFNRHISNNPVGISQFEMRSLGGTAGGVATLVAVGFVILTSIIVMMTAGVSLIDFFTVCFDAVLAAPY